MEVCICNCKSSYRLKMHLYIDLFETLNRNYFLICLRKYWTLNICFLNKLFRSINLLHNHYNFSKLHLNYNYLSNYWRCKMKEGYLDFHLSHYRSMQKYQINCCYLCLYYFVGKYSKFMFSLLNFRLNFDYYFKRLWFSYL